MYSFLSLGANLEISAELNNNSNISPHKTHFVVYLGLRPLAVLTARTRTRPISLPTRQRNRPFPIKTLPCWHSKRTQKQSERQHGKSLLAEIRSYTAHIGLVHGNLILDLRVGVRNHLRLGKIEEAAVNVLLVADKILET